MVFITLKTIQMTTLPKNNTTLARDRILFLNGDTDKYILGDFVVPCYIFSLLRRLSHTMNIHETATPILCIVIPVVFYSQLDWCNNSREYSAEKNYGYNKLRLKFNSLIPTVVHVH